MTKSSSNNNSPISSTQLDTISDQVMSKIKPHIDDQLDSIAKKLGNQIASLKHELLNDKLKRSEKEWKQELDSLAAKINSEDKLSLGPPSGPTGKGLIDPPSRWKRIKPF